MKATVSVSAQPAQQSEFDRAVEFKKELTSLINRYSVDNYCQTPDFILADSVVRHLIAVAETVRDRETWFYPSDASVRTTRTE